MRFMYQMVTVGCVYFSIQTAAQAQEVCRIIAHYFVNAPQAFIAERGQQIRPGFWRSNLRFPNASCYIRENADHEHKANCIINSGVSSPAIIANYGKTVERDVDSCLKQIPTGSAYKKRVSDENKNGTISHVVTWENDADDADYSIYLSGDRDEDGSLSNYFSVSWQKK